MASTINIKKNIRNKIRWGIVGIFVLLIIAVFYDVPAFFNNKIDWVNNKTSIGLPNLPEKDFKGRIVDDNVHEIGVNIFGSDARPLMALYKLSKEFIQTWMSLIDAYVSRGELKCYAENALNEILPSLNLSAHYLTDELCMEIDTHEDFKKAESLLSTL